MVLPRQAGFGLRQLEAVGDEFALFHVEFAHDGGVGTATRQLDQGQGVVGLDDFGARPHPVLVIGAAKCIDVDDDVPLRLFGAVAGQRGAPPQPARVLGIAPEVVQVLAATPHIRDARIGVEHLQRLGAHLLEPVAAELGESGLVVLAHPVQRVVAGDVLEPQIGCRPRQPLWR